MNKLLPAFVLISLTASTTLQAQFDFVTLTNQHADVLIGYDAEAFNPLSFVIRNDDDGSILFSNEVRLAVSEAGQLSLPPDTPFGDAGDPIWILPQSQNADLLFLGLSGDGLPLNVFSEPVKLSLLNAEGPGDFFLWQSGSIGSFDVRINTRDGLTAADNTLVFAGGHDHYNWGFTSTGSYHLTFQASGTTQPDGIPVTSPETTFVFDVLPLRPYEQWQRAHWPPATALSQMAPDSDPDGDGIPNIMEYALALDPNIPTTDGLPKLVIIGENNDLYAALEFTRVKTATDLAYQVRATDSLNPSSWEPLTHVVSITDHGATETVVVRDVIPLPSTEHRFYKLDVAFN
ncbi:MAG TPA: choice-of-anchor M domain-containing protein [Methylomirabilota bacterium]|nr:choice-of-anchor M domain-containing protein [Methylomirabilota bacterium]